MRKPSRYWGVSEKEKSEIAEKRIRKYRQAPNLCLKHFLHPPELIILSLFQFLVDWNWWLIKAICDYLYDN